MPLSVPLPRRLRGALRPAGVAAVAGLALVGLSAVNASGTPAGAGAAAAGTTYYVDAVNGSDANAGTSASAAWKSLSKVNGFAFKAGDTVSFKRGQRWTGALRLGRGGTASAPLRVNAYGTGDRPVFGGGGANECVLVTGSHITVSGVRATGCAWAGFEIRGSHVTLDAIRADNNVTGVSITDGAAFNTVRGSEIVDNNRMSVDDPGGDDDSGAFGVLLNGDDNTITGNTISGSFATSHDYGYDGAAVEVFNGDRNRVEYNVARDNETFTELGAEPGATADGNVFAYNAVTSVHDTGAFLVTRGPEGGPGPVTGTTALNNSVSLPGGDTAGWVCYGGCAPEILKLRNNVIAVGGKTGYEDGAGADEDNGVYWGGQTQFDPGPHSVEADPLFTSATDLRPAAGSPAIGRGVPVGYTVDITGKAVPATAPDAGAYQH